MLVFEYDINRNTRKVAVAARKNAIKDGFVQDTIRKFLSSYPMNGTVEVAKGCESPGGRKRKISGCPGLNTGSGAKQSRREEFWCHTMITFQLFLMTWTAQLCEYRQGVVWCDRYVWILMKILDVLCPVKNKQWYICWDIFGSRDGATYWLVFTARPFSRHLEGIRPTLEC